MKDHTKTIRWFYLALGVVMMLFAGVLYAWSILKSPLTKSFGWDSAALGLNFTISICFFCLGGFLRGLIAKKLSSRLAILLAAALVLTGFTILSNLQGSITTLYLSYGVLAALGIGIAYNTVITSVTSWFPDKRATASGALMMGFGASTFALGSIVGNMFNHLGWRSTYLMLGVSIAVVFVIGSFIIKTAGADAKLTMPKVSEDVGERTAEYAPADMIKRASFWKFYVLIILLSSIGTCVISFAKDITLKVGTTESTAILLVGILSICNGLGRIVTGGVYDLIGRRKTMLIVNGITIFAPFVFTVSVMTKSVPLVVFGIVLVGLTFGALPTINSAYAGSFYGKKNFAINFSIINTTLIFASFSSTIGGEMVKTSGSYISTFIMLLCFAIAGLVVNFTITKA